MYLCGYFVLISMAILGNFSNITLKTRILYTNIIKYILFKFMATNMLYFHMKSHRAKYNLSGT
jgi:hypothetical protein